jgi:hypothetical protein
MHTLAKIAQFRLKPINSQASHGTHRSKTRPPLTEKERQLLHKTRPIQCSLCGCTVKAHHLRRHIEKIHSGNVSQYPIKNVRRWLKNGESNDMERWLTSIGLEHYKSKQAAAVNFTRAVRKQPRKAE